MKPITREEYYLAKIAGTWQGKTPEPVTIEEYYLATMAGDYSGNTPQPVTRLQYYMAKAAGVWGGSIPAPVTRLEYYWAAIAGKEGHIPDPVTRQEYLLYAISQSNNDVINTVFGATIIINDAAEGRPFRGLRVFGRTEQVRTTGAQLLDLSDKIGKTETKNGVTYIINDDQSITVSGKTGDYTSFYIKDMALKAGTYFLKNESRDKNKKIFIQLIGDRIKEGVFTLDKDVSNIGVYFVFNVFGGTVNIFNDTVTTMLNEGSTALPWEPYTGGKPSPSPEYPQEIVSAGESGTINVSISDSGSQSQSLTLATPNGLPGIPVTKDGNYTDADGQQWVCDEIDLGRGKYVQRIETRILDGTEAWKHRITNSGNNNFQTLINDRPSSAIHRSFCNYLPYKNFIWDDNIVNLPKIYSYDLEITASFPPESEFKSVEIWNSWLKEKGDFKFQYVLATPIERDLTPEEIATYKALRTYGPTTVITNDAGTGMEVAYVVER